MPADLNSRERGTSIPLKNHPSLSNLTIAPMTCTASATALPRRLDLLQFGDNLLRPEVLRRHLQPLPCAFRPLTTGGSLSGGQISIRGRFYPHNDPETVEHRPMPRLQPPKSLALRNEIA
jgi:hypothetical protein